MKLTAKLGKNLKMKKIEKKEKIETYYTVYIFIGALIYAISYVLIVFLLSLLPFSILVVRYLIAPVLALLISLLLTKKGYKKIEIKLFGEYSNIENITTAVALKEKLKKETYNPNERANILIGSIIGLIGLIITTLISLYYLVGHNEQYINFISIVSAGLTIFSVGTTLMLTAESNGNQRYDSKLDQLWMEEKFNSLEKILSEKSIEDNAPNSKERQKTKKNNQSKSKKKSH